ncbi:uncharacterized protein AB675_10253 [Cyphellophora attinorum]|uniref:HAUS augmin-like complex subunit 6 N-terminal domain-containing protein n=1 Tax=Cyphellophora attinorum TaxID=1664694 RepID=A0A0N0NJT5_9EURO|nr:uncharacterized protein AB675_10253 [Phialophora attinorum]KPI37351.1 hypothetical protein AB675_10253 [Phialophora attinorum]
MISSTTTRPPARKPLYDGQQQSWPSHGNVASFIRCLHLLDLDLRDDWPHINVQTFSTKSALQNLQLRIRAVEWSLYRLIELWDDRIARDKLQPFFPPQSVLQSQNLRAALLRVLTEFKSNGMLPKDTVLRKTTFDECKGEKFEELLFTVAQATLRKVASRSLGYQATDLNVDADHLVPLIIAHKAVLSKVLHERHVVIKNAQERQQSILTAREDIDERRTWLQAHPPPGHDRRDEVESLLRTAWSGDQKWITALLQASPMQLASGRSLDNSRIAPSNSLSEMQHRVTQQQTYLKRLRHFKDSLPTSAASGGQTSQPPNKPVIPLLRFDEHKQLTGQHFVDEKMCDKTSISVRADEMLSRLKHDLLDDLSLTEGFSQHCSAQSSTEHMDNVSNSLASHIEPKTIVDQTSDSSERSWLKGPSTPAVPRRAPDLKEPPNADALAENRQAHSPVSTDGPSTLPCSSFEEALPALTLAERTRMSMADVASSAPSAKRPQQNGHSTSPDRRPPVEKPPNMSAPASEPTSNLVERTRKSMALATVKPTVPDVVREPKASRASQLYPVNPFETPRRQVSAFEGTPQSNGSTPRESLFSDDVDMRSVFKSRPKIATSPMLSPDRSVFPSDGQDLELEDGSGHD